MSKKIYVVGSSEDLGCNYDESDIVKFMKLLVRQGFRITFDWPKCIFERENKDKLDNDLEQEMETCKIAVKLADVVVFCVTNNRDSIGFITEFGFSLVYNKPIIIYRMYDNYYSRFEKHPFMKIAKSVMIYNDKVCSFYNMCEYIRGL